MLLGKHTTHTIGSLARCIMMVFGRREQWDNIIKRGWVGSNVLGKLMEVLERLVDIFTRGHSII